MATEIRDDRSLGQLLRSLTQELSTLMRQEVELAKTEVSEKASRAGANLGALALGGAVAFAGALALLFAVVNGLTTLLVRVVSAEVAVWLAPLLVGVVLALIGVSMSKKALAALRQEGITPKRTTQSLQENKEWLQEKIK
jgi:xanthine/uracil permease